MEAPVEQTSDLLQKLKINSQNISNENLQVQLIPSHENSLLNSNGVVSSSLVFTESVCNNGNHECKVDSGIYFAPNGYGPPGYVYDYTYTHSGYKSPIGEWEEYPRYVGVDGVELRSAFYGESSPFIIHHPGYGYASPPPYGPYSPAVQMPTMGADGQLYGPSAFQYRASMFQQPALPPGAPFFPTVIGSEGLAMAEPTCQATNGPSSAVSNGSVVALGPRPCFPLAMISPHGPYPKVVIPSNIHSLGPQDVRTGFEGFRPHCDLADAPKNTELQPKPIVSGAVQGIASQPMPGPGHLTQQYRCTPQMQLRISAPLSNQPTKALNPALWPGSLGRGYLPLSRSVPYLFGVERAGRGAGSHDWNCKANGNGRMWAEDKIKLREPAFEFLNNGKGNLKGHLGVFIEQNRGPRISKLSNLQQTPLAVNQIKDKNGHLTENGDSNTHFHREQYNRSDFTTSYKDAKFFVIKSYSEDDVHKSIKYQVWASTPNGNKRLDAAYQEAQARAAGKEGGCPVFLFFSVNASGQFCGLAEMTGSVNFMRSVAYWQQDKWSGQFPVKWHIIKDIPNSQFRHIVLENNDNKPVTNSRDTQEVKFEQGTEMLGIFMKYLSKTSILDDFQFYDNRQKIMQDKKIRRQVSQQYQQVCNGNITEHATSETLSKLKNEKNSNGTMNGSANSVSTFSRGSVSTTKAGSADSPSKDSEVPALKLSSDVIQSEVLETAFQKKSYLRSLKEGKADKLAANFMPKSMDIKASFNERKSLLLTREGVEAK